MRLLAIDTQQMSSEIKEKKIILRLLSECCISSIQNNLID